MKGRLEVITGCMFAGKTEELLRRVERARIAKKRALVLKPEIDTRYSEKEVVTHYGRAFPCHRIPQDVSFSGLYGLLRKKLEKAHVIAFDEAHFFGREFPELCEALIREGKRVIVAGLDLNFRGEPFGPMPELLALADEVSKLQAVCVKCGKPATRTQRLIDGEPVTSGPEIQIGGTETYEARCRDCWVAPFD